MRGAASTTRAQAIELLADVEPSAVLWVESPAPSGTLAYQTVEPRELVRLLGQAFEVVVLDAHAGLDADLLGQSHGLIWGGGALVLRLPERDAGAPAEARAALAVFPFTPEQVTDRFHAHVEATLARVRSPARLVPLQHRDALRGHAEQARVVERLRARWSTPGPSRSALLADRGRGKSSALGLALAELASAGQLEGRRVCVSAANRDALVELFRFAGPARERLEFVPFAELVFGDARFDLIVIDEAAQLPVPMLRALVEAHADAHLCFATTTHGYEGTGRGFALRFLTGLEQAASSHAAPPLERLTLSEPIRWDPGDPLERLVFDMLLLDAEPAALSDADLDDIGEDEQGELVTERLDRDALLTDPALLRELFGLLVHAHYRTTPGDLHRLLDAPNLAVHVLRRRGHVLAANLVAEEGELPASLCVELRDGVRRIRAHALPELLVAHLGHVDAGRLKMIRSVRLATHPKLRRRGLARMLIEHTHRHYAPDLFGTVFGATPELLGFRRALGYELVRVSASRGARTGEPSVMMIRPCSPAAIELVAKLRREFARDVPRLLELLEADGETLLDPALRAAIVHELPEPAPLDAARCRALVESYVSGPRTFESVALALQRFVESEPERLAALDPAARILIEARVCAASSWRQASAAAGFNSVPAAMRALRRAVRTLVRADDR